MKIVDLIKRDMVVPALQATWEARLERLKQLRAEPSVIKADAGR